jgi:hypothetical protein
MKRWRRGEGKRIVSLLRDSSPARKEASGILPEPLFRT